LRAGLHGHHLEAMLLLAMVTGIRRDELRRLTWSQVDLPTGKLSLLNSKTKSHIRCIPLSEEMISVLRKYALDQVEHNRDDHAQRKHSALVFPNSTGRELSITCLLQQWYALCKQVGLPWLCFHDLRGLLCCRLFEQVHNVRKNDDDTPDTLFDSDGDESSC
jgi:integrase